jgi:hypothetical protein
MSRVLPSVVCISDVLSYDTLYSVSCFSYQELVSMLSFTCGVAATNYEHLLFAE